MGVFVSDSMIDAAIDRLNELKAADANLGVVLLPWGEIVKEVYLAMEIRRRADCVQPLLVSIQ